MLIADLMWGFNSTTGHLAYGKEDMMVAYTIGAYTGRKGCNAAQGVEMVQKWAGPVRREVV